MDIAEHIASDMDIEPIFPTKQRVTRKKHFDENGHNEENDQNEEAHSLESPLELITF